MSFNSVVSETVLKYPELKIIDSQLVYKEKFGNISEQVFYKTLSRLEKKGQLNRISKGVYCKPRVSRFGVVTSGEKDILEYLMGTNKNKGIVVGYKMYLKYGLTTQVTKTIDVYSNVPFQERKIIRNVAAKRIELKFEPVTIKMIELLEVLENYSRIENLDRKNLFLFLKKAVECYDEKLLQKVQKHIKYKKSTLASLKTTLDYFGVNNNISSYLKTTSTYSTINMEALHEFAS